MRRYRAWRLRYRFSGRSFRLGCFLGALARSRDPAKLFLRGVEQIVGLVRRLGLRRFVGGAVSCRLRLGCFGVLGICIDRARLFVGGERFLAAIGPGVSGIASYGRSSRPRDPAKLFLRGVEQIVGLVRRLGLRPFVGGERFLAGAWRSRYRFFRPLLQAGPLQPWLRRAHSWPVSADLPEQAG